MSCGKTFLTEDLKAAIGTGGERREVTLWGVEKEGLRRFTQALMDADPRFWDEDFARDTRFGGIITPAIYCTYLGRTPPGVEDPVSRAFREDPVADGSGTHIPRRPTTGARAAPPFPPELGRVLNAGNEVELFQYPRLGDRIFSQGKLANIVERTGRDGNHMLIVTNETAYTNQKSELLCITRSSTIRR